MTDERSGKVGRKVAPATMPTRRPRPVRPVGRPGAGARIAPLPWRLDLVKDDTTPSQHSAGQSLAEFVLIIPILFLITLAVGDFGRVYVSAVAIESGAREAADYGAFKKDNWCVIDAVTGFCTDVNVARTVAEMERRACAAASTLPDYVGAADGSSCTNPTMSYALEDAPDAFPYVSGCDLSEQGCVKVVHVTLTHVFDTFIDFPPLPATVDIVRESHYAISELKQPTFGGP